jgi:hypothetical protein
MMGLVVGKKTHPAPPEVLSGMFDATLAWASKHKGKMDEVWSFAWIQGGGGVFNGESLEELDTVMVECP